MDPKQISLREWENQEHRAASSSVRREQEKNMYSMSTLMMYSNDTLCVCRKTTFYTCLQPLPHVYLMIQDVSDRTNSMYVEYVIILDLV